MEGQENISEGTTQSAPEMVDIHDASDEDLDAFIASDTSLDEEESQVEEAKEPEEKQPEKRSEKEPEKKLSVEELESKLKTFEEENAKLKAHNKNVELWNKRQGTEIGELRKAIKDAIAKKSEGLNEKFLENPLEASKDLDAIRKAENDLLALDSEEAIQQHIERTYQVVSQHIPEGELDIEAMAKTLEGDGLNKDFINAFVQNPFSQAHGETIIQLNKRAVAEKRLVEAVGIVKQLVAEREKLIKGKRDILSGVERASKQMPSVNGSSGGAKANSRGSKENFSEMTDAELDEYLKANS